MIRTGPLSNVDILIGVTADESLYFAEEHMINHYLPKKYRTNSLSQTTLRTLTIPKPSIRKSIEQDQPRGVSYFKKNQYIKKYLEANYPQYLCFYKEIKSRYMPDKNQQNNLTEIAHRYTDLVR